MVRSHCSRAETEQKTHAWQRTSATRRLILCLISLCIIVLHGGFDKQTLKTQNVCVCSVASVLFSVGYSIEHPVHLGYTPLYRIRDKEYRLNLTR